MSSGSDGATATIDFRIGQSVTIDTQSPGGSAVYSYRPVPSQAPLWKELNRVFQTYRLRESEFELKAYFQANTSDLAAQSGGMLYVKPVVYGSYDTNAPISVGSDVRDDPLSKAIEIKAYRTISLVFKRSFEKMEMINLSEDDAKNSPVQNLGVIFQTYVKIPQDRTQLLIDWRVKFRCSFKGVSFVPLEPRRIIEVGVENVETPAADEDTDSDGSLQYVEENPRRSSSKSSPLKSSRMIVSADPAAARSAATASRSSRV